MPSYTQRQKNFVDYYIQTGNQTEAARLAGYKNPTVMGCRVLPKVADILKSRLEDMERSRLADMQEINEFWTDVMRDKTARMIDRLKASELRAKVEGAFVENIVFKCDPNIAEEIEQYMESHTAPLDEVECRQPQEDATLSRAKRRR